MKHLCAAMFEEKKRMSETGFELNVAIGQDSFIEEVPTLMHQLTDLSSGKLISLSSIDIFYCPYCGEKLNIKKYTGF